MSSTPFEEGGSNREPRPPEPRAQGIAEYDRPYGSTGTAIRGRSAGGEGWTGIPGPDPLAKFLGWFSIGLGAVELFAPSTVARAIGVRPSPIWNGVLQFFGVREMVNGAGILANPTSKEWVGMRIGGDALDLATLGIALIQAERPSRTLGATGFVLGAMLLDILGTERLAEKRKAPTREYLRAATPIVLRSITIGRPVNEVYAYWKNSANFPNFMHHVESVNPLDERRSRWSVTGPAGTRVEWVSQIVEDRANELIAWQTEGQSDLYHAGRVTFRAAPRGDGTVVTVEMEYAPPGGRIAAALLKLFRKEPGQQVIDDLRRLKQVLEVGEVVNSNASVMPGIAAAQPHNERPEPSTVH